MYRSPPPSAMLSGPTREAQITFACVCTTAFGRDVVPEVNMIPTGSIGSAARSGSAAPSPTSSANAIRSAPPSARARGCAGSPLSSSVTAIHFRCLACAATRSAYCGCATAATHFAWLAKYSTSGPALLVLVVTATAPSSAHPYHASTISGQLSAWIITRSPLPTPRRASPAPIARAPARNCA
jgi:hypothetical protein